MKRFFLCPNKVSIEDQWSKAISMLDVYDHRVEIREEIPEDLNPKAYNSRLFQEWRRQLDLETIDLTGDSTDSD